MSSFWSYQLIWSDNLIYGPVVEDKKIQVILESKLASHKQEFGQLNNSTFSILLIGVSKNTLSERQNKQIKYLLTFLTGMGESEGDRSCSGTEAALCTFLKVQSASKLFKVV